MHLMRTFMLPTAGALWLACAGGQATTPLPRTLHGLARTEVLSGDDAAQAIARLHGQTLAPAESYVGRYEEDGIGATLYMSRFAVPNEAAEQVLAMGERIRGGASGFGHYRALEIGGSPVHSVLGQRQIHFFYATGRDVMWVSAHPMLARALLGELLDIHADSIPNLMPPAPVGAGTASASWS